MWISYSTIKPSCAARAFPFAFFDSIYKLNPFLCIFFFARCVLAAFENTDANFFFVTNFGFIALLHRNPPFKKATVTLYEKWQVHYYNKKYNRALIGRLIAQPHGNLTPAWFSCSPTHCLRHFERSNCGCKGVSLSFLLVVAHEAAKFISRRSVSRSSLCGISWRTHRSARSRKNVSDLPYTASPLSCVAFFLKERERSYILRLRKGVGASALIVRPRNQERLA